MCAPNEMEEGADGEMGGGGTCTGSRGVVIRLRRPRDEKLGQTVTRTWHFLCIYHIQKWQNKSPSNPRLLKEDIKREIKNEKRERD